MSNVFEFVAESRDLSGKTSARAARRQGKVPAIIYGGEGASESLVLDHNDVVKHLEHEAVYSHVLDLTVSGKTQKALLKDVQRHPARPQVLHMDFLRVTAGHELRVNVPLHFINEDSCVGVKAGGVATHAIVDVEVVCLPKDLPEYIEVDLASLDIGDSLHLSDIVLPQGVDIPELAQGDEHDSVVAQIAKMRPAVESEEEESEEIEADEGQAE